MRGCVYVFSLLAISFWALWAGSGCFTELRSLSCTSDAECFTHEDEACVIPDGEREGRCFRVVPEEVGNQVEGDGDGGEEERVRVFGRVLDEEDDAALRFVRIREAGGAGEMVCSTNSGVFDLQARGILEFDRNSYKSEVLFQVEGGWEDSKGDFWSDGEQVTVRLRACGSLEVNCSNAAVVECGSP